MKDWKRKSGINFEQKISQLIKGKYKRRPRVKHFNEYKYLGWTR